MDPQHREMLLGEYLASLANPADRQRILDAADTSRAFVAGLAPFQPGPAVGQGVHGPHVDAIRAESEFQVVLGQRSYQFAYVDLRQLIALQPWIEPRRDPIPTQHDEILAFALPRNWEVPAEVSFIPPAGPIQILTSSPAMQGLRAEFDQATATVRLGAARHLNLIQVTHFQGRFFLMNGYHRAADALAAGVNELPAYVSDATIPQDLQLPGLAPFNAAHILTLPRPPLVADFHTAGSITTKVRERRYGVLIDLVIKPLVIGI